ncbi:hypothetical protein ERO13_A10G229300v2 [Gossypium hirsutum]|nr:hypothetical protein ERO13_A10G229300v2 [Gossypium hirsutum]
MILMLTGGALMVLKALIMKGRKGSHGLLKNTGDWRNISRNFVGSKTPTQVASHAQKYQKWKLPRGKDEKKPSIHDVTVLDLTGTTVFSDDRKPPSANHSNVASQQKPASMSKTSPNDGSATVFDLVNDQYVKSRL